MRLVGALLSLPAFFLWPWPIGASQPSSEQAAARPDPEQPTPPAEQPRESAPVHPPQVQLSLLSALNHPAVAEDELALPSPTLKRIMLSPRCQDERTVLRLFEVESQTLREQAVMGAPRALAWLDDVRYVVMRSEGNASLLEIIDARTGKAQRLDELPLAAEARWAEPAARSACGLTPGSYLLRVLSSLTGPVLALAIRRGDTTFDLHRYTLSGDEAADPIVGRTSLPLGASKEPPRHRLWQVVPDGASAKAALIWLNQPGSVPAVQIDLVGPLAEDGSTQTIFRSNEDLSGCHFASAGRLLCHMRSGHDQGWLLLIGTEGRGPRPLNRRGRAAAYALSPDGESVAYVGSGGGDGPVTVHHLGNGVQVHATLGIPGPGCEMESAMPWIFWPSPEYLVARGYCEKTPRILSLAAPPAVEPPPQGTLPAAAALGEAPAPKGKTRAARRPSRSRPRATGAFWSPLY